MKAALYTALILMGAALVAMQPDKTTTIFMIGDSTMANKGGIDKGNKERGWGMALQSYFDDNIVIDNHAVNGRSTLSFINEGRWDKVKAKMKPGDLVIIQFGHNDEKPNADRHTVPGSTFDYNLAKFVRETRELGGVPVLMNCVVRRRWVPASLVAAAAAAGKNIDDESLRSTTATGDVTSDGDSLVFADTHGTYRIAPRDVAERMHCLYVDANKITEDLETSLGIEGSRKLHMNFLPGEEPSVPKGRQDNTHYNVHGAQVVARLLADALCHELPLLTRYRVNYDICVDRNGRGDYTSLADAIASVPEGKKVSIQILGGQWERPALTKQQKKNISITLRMGAEFIEQ